MDFLIQQHLLETWLFVFARLLGWVWIDPLMGRLPWSIRLFMAGALSWIWVPSQEAIHLEPATTAGLIALAFAFLTGAAMGFAARLLVAIAETALPVVGLTASMGLTQVAQEQRGGLDPVLQSLAWWLALVAFFSVNGHLLVIKALGASFAAVPVDVLISAASVNELVQAGGMLLATALQLALPMLVMVLLAHLAFSVLSRTLPGVDGFSVGLTLGAFTTLAGLAMATPLLVSGLAGMFGRLLPQLGGLWIPFP